MSVSRTLCLIGLTIIAACFIVKACNAMTPEAIQQPPLTAYFTTTDELLNVETALQTPEQIKEYTGFKVSFNKDMHLPNWVSWELTIDKTSGPAHRKGKLFFQDKEIAGCPSFQDYSGSGYSRGHMAPAADMKWSEKAMSDCFTMANICPQLQSLNGGAWGDLEERCRLWAQRDSCIIIIAGPVLTDPQPDEFIGETEVAVPHSFFKILLAPYANPPRGIGFIMSNGRVYGGIQSSVVTIDSIENLTGYNFFPSLPDSIQNQIESQSTFHKWNTRN